MSKKRKDQPVRNESEMYEVEQILDKRLTLNGLMYLIRWKDYPDPSDYTWEPIQHLTEVEDLVRKFNEDCDQRVTRRRNRPETNRPESNRPNLARKQQPQESEEEESEPQARRPSRRRKLPSEEKSQADPKHTSVNEDDDEDEEVESHSKPRRVETRKPEPKKEKEQEKAKEKMKAKAKENEKEGKKGRQMEEETEVDRYWEEQGLELGRVHKHHLEDGKLVFSVNLNKGELIYGMIPLRIDEMRALDEDKLVAYMENWARHHLIEKAYQTTQEYKDFQNFWKSAD